MEETRPSISFDFDGVIHSYTTKYTDEITIPDPPVIGIKTMLDELKKVYNIVISSSRAKTDEGKAAIAKYCSFYDIYYDEITNLKVPVVFHVDDRAINFDGSMLNLKYSILRFRQWSKVEDIQLSPGDYGKLYFRLTTLPKSTIINIIEKFGYHLVGYSKLMLIEFALNCLPTEAFFDVWNSIMRVKRTSEHFEFAEIWNSSHK